MTIIIIILLLFIIATMVSQPGGHSTRGLGGIYTRLSCDAFLAFACDSFWACSGSGALVLFFGCAEAPGWQTLHPIGMLGLATLHLKCDDGLANPRPYKDVGVCKPYTLKCHVGFADPRPWLGCWVSSP